MVCKKNWRKKLNPLFLNPLFYRCKVIVVTTNQMLVPRGMKVFQKKETAEGWGFVWLLEQWAQQHNAIVHWKDWDDDDDSDTDYGGFDEEELALYLDTGLL